MAHTANAQHGSHDLAAARKKYINVFIGLIILTVVELVIVALPLGKVLMSLLVGVFSSAKAVVVGYYYMHLEYETKWLKIVACLPIIAFAYAFVLIADTPSRPMSVYINEAPRVFKGHSAEQGETGEEKPEFASDIDKLEGQVLKIEASSGRGAKLAVPQAEQSQSPTNSNNDIPVGGGTQNNTAPSNAESKEADSGEWN